MARNSSTFRIIFRTCSKCKMLLGYNRFKATHEFTKTETYEMSDVTLRRDEVEGGRDHREKLAVATHARSFSRLKIKSNTCANIIWPRFKNAKQQTTSDV